MRATLFLALWKFADPFFFLERARCAFANFLAYRLVCLGLPDLKPSEVITRSFKPKSIPTVFLLIGSGLGSKRHKQDTN